MENSGPKSCFLFLTIFLVMNLNGLMGFPDLGLSRSSKSLNLFEYSDSILCRGCLENTYIIVEVWTWKKVTFAHLVTSNDLYCSHRILLNIGIIRSFIKVIKFLEIFHPYPIKLHISHPECCLSVLITLLMAFIPLTWYWVRTSSRLLFPTRTWNTFSNLFSPPNTATADRLNMLLTRLFCRTCSGKKASPAICSNFCHFAISNFLSTAEKLDIYRKVMYKSNISCLM